MTARAWAACMPGDFDIVRGVIDAKSSALATFDYLIAHAQAAAGFVLVPRLSQVRSIELQWPDRRQNPFSVQASAHHVNFYLRRPALAPDPALFDLDRINQPEAKPARRLQ